MRLENMLACSSVMSSSLSSIYTTFHHKIGRPTLERIIPHKNRGLQVEIIRVILNVKGNILLR